MSLLVIGILGLALGIFFGLPGRYQQTPEDIEKLMETGGRSRKRRPKREISPLAWLQRQLSAKSHREHRGRGRGFKLESPDERDRS